ncbi:MAG: DUF58 domain-containing protein [Bifidobacteriaceae bacterium]|jgi:hypothetical protein|nr:DUF58 domain-containing protein [Bifidobacteriaceae bacterium]
MTYLKRLQFRKGINLPLVRRAYLSITGKHLSIFKGSGLDFDELREYVPGDQIQSIDWKSSARRGSLVVKNFEISTITDSVILADASRLMFSQGQNNDKLIDIAVFASSLIGLLSVDRGDKTTILYSDKSRLIHEKTQNSQFTLNYSLHRLSKSAQYNGDGPDISKSFNYILQFWPKRMNLSVVASLPTLLQVDKALLAKIAIRYDTLIIGLVSKNPYSKTIKIPEYDIVNYRRIPAFLKSKSAYRKYNNFVFDKSSELNNYLKSIGIHYIQADSIASFLKEFISYIARRKLTK